MYEVLVQQKVAKALRGFKCLPKSLTEEQNYETTEMASSTLTLHLDYKVLREFSSLVFKMIDSKSIRDNLDDYNRLILDLENLDIKVEEEDKAIILLNSLPKSYGTLVETMKYSRDTLFLSDV